MRVFRHNPAVRYLLYGLTVAFYVFVFAPIVIVIYASFDPNEVLRFPYKGFSFRWYEEFFRSELLLAAIRNSVVFGLAASIGASIAGLIAALIVVRFSFRGKGLLEMVIISPMVISKIVLGAALISLMASLEIPRSWINVVMLHVLIAMPFAFLVIWARLLTLERSYEEAALVLGADELAATFEVTMPLIAPAIIGGMLLSFTVSFDEFSATQFLVTPATTTIPVQVYSMIQTAITPTVNVLATLLTVVTMALPAMAWYGLGGLRRGWFGR